MPKKGKNKKKQKTPAPQEVTENFPEEAIEDEIKGIAPELKPKQVKEVARIVGYSVRKIYSGPLPPPGDFKKYEEVLPGSAERILSMAEKQSNHRQSMEKIILPTEIKKTYLGMTLGFILGAGTIVLGFILLLKNRDPAGLATIVSALVALVGVFIYGRKEQKAKQ